MTRMQVRRLSKVRQHRSMRVLKTAVHRVPRKIPLSGFWRDFDFNTNAPLTFRI